MTLLELPSHSICELFSEFTSRSLRPYYNLTLKLSFISFSLTNDSPVLYALAQCSRYPFDILLTYCEYLKCIITNSYL